MKKKHAGPQIVAKLSQADAFYDVLKPILLGDNEFSSPARR